MINLRKLKLYYSTIRHLKFKQIYFQIFYRFRKSVKKRIQTVHTHNQKVFLLSLQPSIPSPLSFRGNSDFVFLNLEKSFSTAIDWNYRGYGKLWAYNLNYFDYLNQENIKMEAMIKLLNSFCENFQERKEGAEPYPISLRGINWIKFFSFHRIINGQYNQVLFSHYRFLCDNLEYHLLGNHLLENGFSLFFAAYYFQDEGFYKKAVNVLLPELNEQILEDGGHFELSPMYHQIILFRLLDTINLVKNNSWKGSFLLDILTEKCSIMLGWLKTITFQNGDIPMVNDSAYDIAPESKALFDYASRLGILSTRVSLAGSGYRMISLSRAEVFIDVGNIGPEYIPGHAHSDTLSFVLYSAGQPTIVDTGTSTYENGQTRLSERSTESHNTITINNQQQSEVWASFRVGRRAKIIQIKEDKNKITASHDAYKSIGLIHERSWQWNENLILIKDEILGKAQNINSIASFHFHPDVNVRIEKDSIHAGAIQMECNGQNHLEIEEYNFAAGFNKIRKGKVLRIYFMNELCTTIRIT